MNSILDIIHKHVIQQPDQPALMTLNDATYTPLSYAAMALRTEQLAHYLMARHAGNHSHVIIWAENGWRWAVSDMAIQRADQISVPLYPTIGDDQLGHILQDVQPGIIILDALSKKQWSILQAIETLHTIIVFDPSASDVTPDIMISFDNILQESSVSTLDNHAWTRDRRSNIFTVLYTSGTTGFPKSVPLTHNNVVQNFIGLLDAMPINHTDRALSFLPLSHIFERTVGFYCVLGMGATIYYARSITTVVEDIITAAPTFLISVPRLYEKIHQKVWGSSRGIQSIILRWAVRVGANCDSSSLAYRLAHRLVFSKIHQKMGGHIRFLVTGGAPISPTINAFFNAIGLPIVQGYGLTETSPIISANFDQVVGSVGRVLANLEVILADDNEICVKGPSVFSGYGNVPNDDTFTVDGFFKTGDTGYMDDAGYLYVTGRKKELIVLSNGKNVAPNHVEDHLIQSIYIQQAVVIGDQRHYLTALVVPDYDTVSAALGIASNDVSTSESAHALILNDCHRLSAPLAEFETVKNVALLHHELSIEGTELTPTLKIRRENVSKKYAPDIQAMYDS